MNAGIYIQGDPLFHVHDFNFLGLKKIKRIINVFFTTDNLDDHKGLFFLVSTGLQNIDNQIKIFNEMISNRLIHLIRWKLKHPFFANLVGHINAYITDLPSNCQNK